MFNKKIWKKIEQIKEYIYAETDGRVQEIRELREEIYYNRKRIEELKKDIEEKLADLKYLNKNRFEDLERDSLLKGSIVFCEECGVAVKADKAKKIFIGRYLGGTAGDVEYYCDRHAPRYDKVVEERCIEQSYKDGPKRVLVKKYFKNNVEVDKKGRIKKSKK